MSENVVIKQWKNRNRSYISVNTKSVWGPLFDIRVEDILLTFILIPEIDRKSGTPCQGTQPRLLDEKNTTWRPWVIQGTV